MEDKMGYKDKEKQKEYQKNHHIENKSKYLHSQRQSRNRSKNIIHELKSGGCVRCGFNEHPNCLDFHHIDQNSKEVNLSVKAIADKWGRKRILIEAEKCIVVCANCHRLIHAESGYNNLRV